MYVCTKHVRRGIVSKITNDYSLHVYQERVGLDRVESCDISACRCSWGKAALAATLRSKYMDSSNSSSSRRIGKSGGRQLLLLRLHHITFTPPSNIWPFPILFSFGWINSSQRTSCHISCSWSLSFQTPDRSTAEAKERRLRWKLDHYWQGKEEDEEEGWLQGRASDSE